MFIAQLRRHKLKVEANSECQNTFITCHFDPYKTPYDYYISEVQKTGLDETSFDFDHMHSSYKKNYKLLLCKFSSKTRYIGTGDILNLSPASKPQAMYHYEIFIFLRILLAKTSLKLVRSCKKLLSCHLFQPE